MRKSIILLLTLLSIFLISCSSQDYNVETGTEEVESEEKDFTSYTKANFIELNIPEAERNDLIGKEVYVEGTLNDIDTTGLFHSSDNAMISQEENDGFGVYMVYGSTLTDSEAVKGDKVRIYGLMTFEPIMGIETSLLVEKVEVIN